MPTMLKYGAHPFDAITIGLTGAVERMSFDAWGRRRNAIDCTYYNLPTYFGSAREGVVPCFTGQQVDAFRWKNMLSEAKSREQSDTGNGRVYDPCQGRFLSPDVLVQSPDFTQDYNRYSYVLNNPLKYTDPSGYTRPPFFDDYWNEYMYLMKPGLEMRLLAEENAEIFAEWFVKDVKGQWIRRENAVDVTGKGNYVNKNEVIRLEGKEAADFIWAVNLFNSLSSYVSTLISIGITNYQIGFGFKNKVAFSLTIANGSAYLTWQTVIIGKPQSVGGAPEWAYDINIGIGAFNAANGLKSELLDYAVRSNFKSARTWSEFNDLRSTQQAWRTVNTLGESGATYLKFVKGLGYIGAGLTSAYSVTNAGMYYYNGGTDWQVGAKATLDIIMTGVGFLGPIGFGISATYFILDATTGGFGGFGKTK